MVASPASFARKTSRCRWRSASTTSASAAPRWIEELTQRFPSHDVVRLRNLGFGATSLWLAAAGDTCDASLRIVSEFANVAVAVARRMRLARYRVFPVLGAADAYPPEDADVVLIAARDGADVEAHGLRPLCHVLDSSACLIANRRSLASHDLSGDARTSARRKRRSGSTA